MQIYNTLSRKKEEFIPNNGNKVNMYVCGITAYALSHIGHARSAVAFDVLARMLRFNNYDLTFVRNFTDVDDKIIARANDEGCTSEEISETYMKAFHEDMDMLNVLRPDIEPRATKYIDQMIEMIDGLIKKNKAYATASGDVYFKVREFDDYGKLSGRSPDDLRSGARIAPGEEKDDPLDFALWKSAKPGEPSWKSPWGDGRPGWHIECSAMSEDCFNAPLDIHGGGLDLIFPHHENEIAQSEAFCEHSLAKYWVHNGFVQVNSEKMSKSLGNFKTIRDIFENYLPELLRFFLLLKHYRSPIDFSTDGLDETERSIRKIYECLNDLNIALSREKYKKSEIDPSFMQEFNELDNAVIDAMNDDCNTAAAIGHIFNLVHLTNRALSEKTVKQSEKGKELFESIKKSFEKYSTILGVFAKEPSSFLLDLRNMAAKRKNIDISKIEALLQERSDARANKDFAKADEVRARLNELQIEVRDTVNGQEWDII